MNKEDIYFMAKQAGIDSVQQYDSDTSPIVLLERFAKLVAEHEREACAKRLDAVGCDHCATNIRARGQA